MASFPQQLLDKIASIDVCAELLGELVRHYSPSAQEHAVQEYIRNWFESRGIAAELQRVDDGLVNVIARVEGNGPGPHLLICGHTDTALPVDGWNTDPTTPVREGNRLYGLGAMDMKAGIATAMLTMEALQQANELWSGSVEFVAMADEEAFSRGARGYIAGGAAASAAILCEPEFNAPQLGAVGKVLVKVVVIGRAAHGSFPEKGINAVVEAGKLLSLLDQLPMGHHPEIGTGSQCVLGIRGGPDQYVIQVPERCEFIINRHIVPGETGETVLAEMRSLAKSLSSSATFHFTIEPPYYPPYLVEQDHPVVKTFSAAFEHVLGNAPKFGYGRGVCDGNYLVTDASTPTVVFGPAGENLHAANEWADLTQMPLAMEVYLRTAYAWLQQEMSI